jgi:hypothetical protein
MSPFFNTTRYRFCQPKKRIFRGTKDLDNPCGSKPVEDQKMPLITREFGLALKVQLSKVRTDTESGGKADARQGT